MSLFKTNICTVVFDGSKYSYFCGVIDGEKESYINKYCNVLYNFFNKCINDKTIKIIVIYEMNLQDI